MNRVWFHELEMMKFLKLLLAVLSIGTNTVIAENDDGNITLSKVVVSLSSSLRYYHKIEGDELQITCTANCDPPCQYQWYHQNFQANGSVLNVNVTKEMDYDAYGPLLCLASNEESGPFSSDEIRIYVKTGVLDVPSWIDIDEGDTLVTCLLENPNDCRGNCYLHDPFGSRGYNENCYNITMERYLSGQWYWYYSGYRYFYFTVNIFITPSNHTLVPNVRQLIVNSSTTSEVGPIRFIGRCKPLCSYIWYKDDIIFSFGNTLYIENLNQNYSGRYECKVYNGTEMIDSTAVDLHIYDAKVNTYETSRSVTGECSERPSLEKYRHQEYMSEVSYTSTQYKEVMLGTYISLTCKAVCKPACTHFRWYYPGGTVDGQNLYTHVDESYGYTTGNNILFCLAWNDCFASHASSNLYINVMYNPQNVTLGPNGNINVEDGSSTGNLTVTAECNPPCTYRLRYKNSNYNYYDYLNTDNFETTVSKKSEGIWQWRIHNRYSTIYREFKVFVWDPHHLIPNDIHYVYETSKCIGRDIGPIRFIGICNPNCTYVWYKNGVPFSMGNTLLLDNVSSYDNGEYQCVGFNQHYNVTSNFITINITEIRYSNSTFGEDIETADEQSGTDNCTIPSTTILEQSNLRDDARTCNYYLMEYVQKKSSNYSLQTFHDSLKTVAVQEGTSFTATCIADCNPECQMIRWYFPGGSSEGNVLYLNNVTMSFHYTTGGQVYCLAWNDCKWPQSSRGIQLNVGYGPRNIIFNATDAVYTVTEGDSLGPFICAADCFEECEVYWSGTHTYYKNVLYFSNVVRSIEYDYWRCHLHNSFGSHSSHHFEIDVKHGPKNPTIIPMTYEYDFRNTDNPTLPLIRCTAECDPTCTYIWYRNKKFYSNANVLQIQNIAHQDHGKYNCYAFNDHGNYTFKAVDIILFDNPSYLIYEPSQASYELQIGDHLGPINCSADCNPECEYYWSTPTGRITGRLLNISITSPIQGGEYACHAWNVNYDWSSEPLHVDTDPCSESNYSPLSDYERRSQGTKITSAPLCDQQLEENWYRAGFTDIPTEPPSMFSCGTTYPIWINASVPNERKIFEIQACASGLHSDCDHSFQVSVKNCGDYRVYRLKPTDICPSAYCLDVNDDTPPTGEIGSASTSFSHIQWLNTRPRAGRFKRKPNLMFKCEFTPVHDSEMYYSINWYVDQKPVIVDQTVSPNDPPLGYMSSEELKGFSAQIHCAVGAKKHRNGKVGKLTNAAPFFAGLQVTKSITNILRGQSSVIFLEQTVPFACDENVIEGRHKSIANPSDCQISLDLHAERTLTVCGRCTKMFGFTGEDDYKRRNGTWTKTHSVTICHKDDGSFDKTDTDFTIYFLTDRVYAENVWNNAKSPSTKVRVSEPLDNQWQSRYCYDLLDPHLRTFDGSHYQSHENGKYLLYRNNKTMQEVHVKHRPCFGSVSDPYCLCGVAARAGRDVFVINICDRNNLMEYTLCDDGALSVTKTSERYYNIYFPSGTSVSISIRTTRRPFWINLNIYPSVTDQFNVDGLCSSLDGRTDNDFNLRYSSNSAYPELFTDSWRLSSVEDLFNENAYSRLSRLQTKKFCSCSSNNEEKCNFENQQITSKYSERKITCALYSNGLNRRKKRSVSSRLQGISQDDSPYNLERHKRSSGINTSITEKMSEDEAKSYCELTMNSSTAYSECLSTIDVLDQSYIDSCTEDLKMSGDTNLTNAALESFLETCTTYTFKNNTIREENINFTRTILNLCPNGCSGNGDCIEGNCTCYETFAGADCSFNLHDPPEIDSIINNGTCDFTEDDCNEINLYGEFFMDDGNSTCRHTETKVFVDGTRLNIGNWKSKGSARTLFEGVCIFEYSKINLGKDYVTEISVAYSNNGQLYSKIQTHILYDSACQTTDTSNGMKDGYCFIDGRCVLNRTSDKVRGNCFICDTDKDKFNWTFADGFCFINNKCILNGTEDGDYPCHICDISDKGINTWSLNHGHCVINDTCYRDGDTKEGSDCKYCDSSKCISTWSINNSFCYIKDECFDNGATNSSFPCHICDINANNTQWSINKEHCLIDGHCVQSGNVQPNKTCSICNNETRHIWSVTPDFCRINNTCFVNYQENPEDPSSFCNASILTNQEWSYNDSFSQEPYTTGGPPATTETPIPRTPAVFDTHISLDKPFDPQLSYINSTAYSQFKTEIESEVDHLYRSSELKNVFDRNELYGVRNGSTKCDLYIYVNTTKFQRDNTSGQIETVDVDGKLVAETAITQIMKAKQLSDSDHIKLLVQSDTSSITSSKILGTTTQMMTTEVEETTTHDETSDGTTTQETTTDSISTLEATAPETTQQKTTIAETSIQGTTTEASSLIENDFISELFTDKALYIGAAAGVVILIIPIIVIVIVVKLKNNAKMKTQDSGSNKTGDSVSSGSNGSTYEDADSMKGFMQNPNMFRQNYRIPRASLSTSSKTGPYNYIY